jgi:hypothetical protein
MVLYSNLKYQPFYEEKVSQMQDYQGLDQFNEFET